MELLREAALLSVRGPVDGRTAQWMRSSKAGRPGPRTPLGGPPPQQTRGSAAQTFFTQGSSTSDLIGARYERLLRRRVAVTFLSASTSRLR